MSIKGSSRWENGTCKSIRMSRQIVKNIIFVQIQFSSKHFFYDFIDIGLYQVENLEVWVPKVLKLFVWNKQFHIFAIIVCSTSIN